MAEKKKNHKFSHTHIEHFHDGSATVHHVHEDGPHKDKKHAAADLDEVHDSMQDHLGTPNPGEAEATMPPAGGAPAAGMPPMAPPAGA